MRTRSQSRNLNRPQQQVPPTFVETFNLEEPIENPDPPVVTMDDNRTMAQLLEAPPRLQEHRCSRRSPRQHLCLSMFCFLLFNKQFFGHDKEDPHAHIRYFNKITSTMKFPNVPSTSVNQPPAYQAPAYQAPAPQTQGVSKTDFESYVKANDAVMQNMQSQMSNITDLLTKIANSNAASTSGSGSLPSNTVANPKGELKAITTRSGASYDGPQVPPPTSSLPKVVENEPKVTKDTVPPTNNGSTKDVQPPVVHVETQNFEPVVAPVSAPIPNLKPSIPHPSRRNDERRREKANDQIEKFYEIFKDLSFKISLTDALILMPKFASTLKALIRNKEKLSEMARTPLNEHCSAVILNKLPKKLGDPGKFLIPCEFLGIDATERALIDVYEGELTLRVGKEAITFNLDQTSRYPSNYNDMTANRIDVIDMALRSNPQEVIVSPMNRCFLALEDDPTSPEVDHSYYDSEGDILLLEAFLNDDPSLPLPTQGNYLPEIRGKRT
ncbi:hypothetical protein Tco_0619912 [Tanacetum coccineum]